MRPNPAAILIKCLTKSRHGERMIVVNYAFGILGRDLPTQSHSFQ
jgi:hypothetical protein